MENNQILAIILSPILLIIIPSILSNLIYYGMPIKDKKMVKLLEENIVKGVHWDYFDENVLSIGNLPSVHSNFSFILPYGLHSKMFGGYCVIPFWSKSSKIIKKLMKETPPREIDKDLEKIREKYYNS